MDATRIDRLVRALTAALTRRGIARGLAGIALAGPIASLLGLAGAEAKKKRKKKKKKCKNCGPCQSCKKGKCKPKADGTACGVCDECQSGACVSRCATGESCLANGGCCVPDCAGKECGSDGCGESCGTCTGGQTCQSGTCVNPPPFCAGKNSCLDNANCGDGTPCHCLITEETGEPFCGVLLGSLNANCAVDCLPSETCVDVSDCGGTTACATPCANPL
jgi:hypothetical protein